MRALTQPTAERKGVETRKREFKQIDRCLSSNKESEEFGNPCCILRSSEQSYDNMCDNHREPCFGSWGVSATEKCLVLLVAYRTTREHNAYKIPIHNIFPYSLLFPSKLLNKILRTSSLVACLPPIISPLSPENLVYVSPPEP